MGGLKPPPGFTLDVWKSLGPEKRKKIVNQLYCKTQKYKDKKKKHAAVYSKLPHVKQKIKERRQTEKYRTKRKEYRLRADSCPNSGGPRHFGTKNVSQFCYHLLKNMVGHTKLLKTNDLEFTHNDLIALSETHPEFIIDEQRSFSLRYSNGFYNSASMQRWNDDIGYTKANTTPIPVMLQSKHSFTLEDFRNIPNIISLRTPQSILLEWKQELTQTMRCVLYERAQSMKNRTNTTFGFDSIRSAFMFLRETFIRQGGCCAYTGIPMRLRKHTKAFVASVERVNPILGYTAENTVLVCMGVNSVMCGMHLWYRKHENNSEAHQQAVQNAKFNVDYWRFSMKIEKKDLEIIEETRTRNRALMETWTLTEINSRMRVKREPKAKREPQPKRARVEVVDDSDDDFAQFR